MARALPGKGEEVTVGYVITEPCVGTCDTACVKVCPMDCIWGPVPVEEIRAVPEAERRARFGAIQLYINPAECIDCGACEPECPVGAIFAPDQVPEKLRHFIEKNARFFEREG
jgi:NAD-dependent dihydropyrimidine dehydrogenase PreA subunit